MSTPPSDPSARRTSAGDAGNTGNTGNAESKALETSDTLASDLPALNAGSQPAESGERYCPSCDQSFPTSVTRCPKDGTTLALLGGAEDSMIGKEIDGRFTITRRLGRGGMGAAYAALQHSIGREVAIKVIHGHLAESKLGAKRFLRETKLAAQLSHPNTVTVIDFGQTLEGDGLGGRRLYMAMELVDGETLSAMIRRGPISPQRAANIAMQICDALAAAHALQIVHRDLKPSNIMLESDERDGVRVKVLDFGLAKSLAGDDTTVTESNVLVGTPQYIAPEIVVGDPSDTRADLYSLGALLYEMLSGRPPFSGDSVQACLFAHVHDPPPPLGAEVPGALASIVVTLLAKRPEVRYQTALDVREKLAEFASLNQSKNAPVLDRTVTSARNLASTSQREAKPAAIPETAVRGPKVKIFAAVIALAVVSVALFLVTRGASDPPGAIESDAASAAGSDLARDGTERGAAAVAHFDAGPRVRADGGAKAPARVALDLHSVPPGARVRSPDGDGCTTPCVLDVVKSEAPVTLRYTRSGYRSATRDVVPNVDQALRVELARRKSTKSKNSDKTTKSPPRDGFVDGYE